MSTFIHFRWEFISEDGDVAFQVYYLNGKEKIEVIPWSRVDCHLLAEEGRIICTHTAKCQYITYII